MSRQLSRLDPSTPWMLPALPLRLDACSARAHRALKIATRFSQHPPRYNDWRTHSRALAFPARTEAYSSPAPGGGRF